MTAGAAPSQYSKLGAYLLVVADILRLWHTDQDALDRVRRELQERAGPSLSEVRLIRGPATFGNVYAEAVVFPTGATSEAEVEQQVREHMQRYFEEAWIHRPLHALGNVPPIDAAGHPILRKKLLGVVQFLQECSPENSTAYDFDRLRRTLGLLAAAVPGAPTTATLDIEAMNAAELASLEPETLTDAQVEQAYRIAQKLDARELADRFARTMVSRPPASDRPDRFPWYAHLVQMALAVGDTQTALQYVDEGEKADCEQNEGRRRDDYELRRGQVLAKSGDSANAKDVFERLIARRRANCVIVARRRRRCCPSSKDPRRCSSPNKGWPKPVRRTIANPSSISSSWSGPRKDRPFSGGSQNRPGPPSPDGSTSCR